jgi:hypothetical protein
MCERVSQATWSESLPHKSFLSHLSSPHITYWKVRSPICIYFFIDNQVYSRLSVHRRKSWTFILFCLHSHFEDRFVFVIKKTKKRGFTRLSITKSNNLSDWLNVYFGRVCHHQEIQSIFIIIMYHLEHTPKSYELICFRILVTSCLTPKFREPNWQPLLVLTLLTWTSGPRGVFWEWLSQGTTSRRKISGNGLRWWNIFKENSGKGGSLDKHQII